MDFYPVDGMIRHPRSSSDSSRSSFPGMHEDPFMYVCSQSYLSNLMVSQIPYRQEAKNHPLPNSCGWWDELNWMKSDAANIRDTTNVESQPIIENEASVKREEFSFWKNAFFDLVQAHKDSDLNWHLRKLVTHAIKDVKAKKDDLRNHNNQPKFRLTKEVAAPDQLDVAQRILGKVMISMADLNSQIGNLEAKFSLLKDMASQLRLQSPHQKSRAMQRISLKKLSGAICDFMNIKNCCLDVNEYIIRVTADICRFIVAVEDLETNKVMSNDLIMELKIMISNLKIQIAQLFLRVIALLDASVQIEKILRKEHKEAESRSQLQNSVYHFAKEFDKKCSNL